MNPRRRTQPRNRQRRRNPDNWVTRARCPLSPASPPHGPPASRPAMSVCFHIRLVRAVGAGDLRHGHRTIPVREGDKRTVAWPGRPPSRWFRRPMAGRSEERDQTFPACDDLCTQRGQTSRCSPVARRSSTCVYICTTDEPRATFDGPTSPRARIATKLRSCMPRGGVSTSPL